MCMIRGIRTAAGSAAATALSLAGEHWWHCGAGVVLVVSFRQISSS